MLVSARRDHNVGTSVRPFAIPPPVSCQDGEQPGDLLKKKFGGVKDMAGIVVLSVLLLLALTRNRSRTLTRNRARLFHKGEMPKLFLSNHPGVVSAGPRSRILCSPWRATIVKSTQTSSPFLVRHR